MLNNNDNNPKRNQQPDTPISMNNSKEIKRRNQQEEMHGTPNVGLVSYSKPSYSKPSGYTKSKRIAQDDGMHRDVKHKKKLNVTRKQNHLALLIYLNRQKNYQDVVNRLIKTFNLLMIKISKNVVYRLEKINHINHVHIQMSRHLNEIHKQNMFMID